MKESKTNDGDQTTSKWQHKILLGVDEKGVPHARFGKDVLGYHDVKRYLRLARHALNDVYGEITSFNCPTRDEDPINDVELLGQEDGGLLGAILIGTEPVPDPPRDVFCLFVPDHVKNMNAAGDHVEKLITVMDRIIASRRFS